ncbi:Peptidoglycan/LPS O-acetylase OafA/YrhL, contains acyltransferase and SGNH-hydrolase domains [Paraburkholderia lycopersici]|uniref:Peptidoglycan/LPS O-acetylase OafA/YrhL, contains acyltransferase and SGNH-hydrolase domains n=1 Tax=Paraburkholderia lycopersici TaxID=416944 RepID=A0A1G6HQM3_9BURK|nr:acyltransferase [Paraburkholderia lycopersici]SDB96443.1 Peptidoglycan/LPS O-acetylase OafA/YrhL, contains acyltransferase and SGNH-hydrolase domains [Paraburkholderia lycopersici]
MAGVQSRVKGLDGLRALAVVLVFLSHKAHVDAIDAGKIGVWLFFLISGYLIIGELHRNRLRIEQHGARTAALLYVFFMKRALRIFPVYYLLLVALAIAHASFYQRDVELGLAWHFVFLSNYWIGMVHDGWPGTVSHFWSLAVEQQFYLVAPFALLFARASRHLALCAVTIVAAALAHLALYEESAIAPLIYALSPWNFAMLALGGALAIGGARVSLRPGVPGLAWLAGAWAAIGGFALARADCAERAGSAVLPGLFDIGLALSLGALFLWLVRRQESAIVAVLEMRPLAYLGTISYGFYLFHNLVPSRLGVAPGLYARLHVPDAAQPFLALALQFALAVLLAHLSWQVLERRVLEWKRPLETAIRNRLPARATAGQT